MAAGAIIFWATAGPASLYAQESSNAEEISLNEAVELALERNIGVQQAENNLERNDASVRQAYGNFLPDLNASAGANRAVGRQFNQATVEFNEFTQNSINGNLSTSVPIFTGWRNISNLRAAQTDQRASENEYERLREDTIFQTASEFLQVILNKELLEIARDNLDTARQQLEQVEAQVEVGMRPVVDQFNQEAEVANGELQVLQRQNELTASKVRMIRILQLDAFGDYEFVVPDINTDAIIPQEFDFPDLISIALDNRRELRTSQLNIESAEYGLRAARSGYFPTLSFSADISSSYSDQYRLRTPDPDSGQLITETVGFNDQFFDQRINRGLGFNLSIPIFDRFQTRTSVVYSKIDIKNARLDMDDQRSLVFQEVRQAYEDYRTISQALVTTEAQLRAAEKAFETQQERYNVGSATLLELTQANNSFVQASSQRIQAVYQFIFQEKLLDYYLGRIEEDISF
ncbi:MAG: TolC family protein [Cyclonatronaceae bacterium]